jgi:hypothetical protein|tara:strand:+ start:14405 stop:15565 length:1161 start_codon:yes stop_codon:yes gene_type:complete
LYDGSLRGLAKRLVFSLFMSLRPTTTGNRDRDILVFFANRRKQRADYDFIAGELRRVVGRDGDYVEVLEHFNPLQWVSTLAGLLDALRAVSAYSVNPAERLTTALLIARYYSSRRHLAAVLSGKRTLVTFCDALPVENMLTQIARTNGAFTLTAQHGQYRLLDQSNMSPDAEAYANFISDRMLCWGDATRAEFVRAGFEPNRFIVTGWIRPPRSQQEQSGKRPDFFGVMLNGPNANESNKALLSVAKAVAAATGIPYLVRLHPQTALAAIQPLVDEQCRSIAHIALEPYLSSVAFSLGHMSGAVVEVLHEGHPTYLFDDGRLADVFRVEGLSYRSVDELIAAIRADIVDTSEVRERMASLSAWYNDNTNQASRLRAAILNKQGSHA